MFDSSLVLSVVQSSLVLSVVQSSLVSSVVSIFTRFECSFPSGVFIQSELSSLGSSLTLGAVQTAYSNGNSGRYMRDKGINVKLAKTGETSSRI